MRKLFNKIFKKKEGGTVLGNKIASFVHSQTFGLFGNRNNQDDNLFNIKINL